MHYDIPQKYIIVKMRPGFLRKGPFYDQNICIRAVQRKNVGEGI